MTVRKGSAVVTAKYHSSAVILCKTKLCSSEYALYAPHVKLWEIIIFSPIVWRSIDWTVFAEPQKLNS